MDMSAVDRVRAYLDAHAASHRNPDVLANLVPSGRHDGEVVELRVEDLRALLCCHAVCGNTITHTDACRAECYSGPDDDQGEPGDCNDTLHVRAVDWR